MPRLPTSLASRFIKMGASASGETASASFGETGGKAIKQYTLSNGNITVQIMDFGAAITSVKVPDQKGNVGEICLGYDEVTPYLSWKTNPYFGCVAGRVANRIGKGKFSMDEQEYSLVCNNGPNHLHGGNTGFDKCIWKCEAQTSRSVTLVLNSPDGDEGYPGNVCAKVTYSLNTETSLRMEYSATTDQPTPVNLTNHAYWNLASGGDTDVLSHEIEIAADFYTPVDDTSIPTGEIRAVAGAMDLRKPGKISRGIKEADQGLGYDHNYVLRGPIKEANGLQPVARVWEPVSGRSMVVRSDQPGVQFYTGNYLTGHPGRQGKGIYAKHHGFCLETQQFPDAVNNAHFNVLRSIVLRPSQTYKHVTVHEFSVSETAPEGPL